MAQQGGEQRQGDTGQQAQDGAAGAGAAQAAAAATSQDDSDEGEDEFFDALPSLRDAFGGRMEGGKRTTLCVSSEVGCAMGCTFCATGALPRPGSSRGASSPVPAAAAGTALQAGAWLLRRGLLPCPALAQAPWACLPT